MSTKPVIRLHLFFARDNSRAVILRQGPSKVFRMILWNRETDTFEDGQWLKHKVYVERCDLSPDGHHFIYFALDGRWGSMARGSYTAISRPPYFTALALFPQGDTWGGGGLFIDSTHFIIDSSSRDQIGQADGLARAFRGKPGKGCTSGLRLENGTPVPLDPDTRQIVLGRTKQASANPLDLYDTQGGRLYRRRGHDLTLIRDFTDMAFEPIRAPYDQRSSGKDGPPWHPLDGESK